MHRMSLLFSFLICSSSFSQTTMTYSDLLDAALRYNPEFQVSKIDLGLSQETKTQAWGSIYPELNAVGTYDRQDIVSRPVTKSVYLSLTQPLFQGGKEWSALKIAELGVEQSELEVEQAKQDLKLNLYVKYLEIVSAQNERNILRGLLESSEKRESELSKRVKIGRSKSTDFLSAKAQSAKLRSDFLEAENEWKKVFSEIRMMTGIQNKNVSFLDDQKKLPSLKSLDDYLRAYPASLNRKVSQKNVLVAEKEVSYSRGGHFPTLSFSGNYYLYQHGFSTPYDWDFGLTLTFPLFEGGIVQSQVEESSKKLAKAEILNHDKKVKEEEEIRRLYASIQLKQEQFEMISEAVDFGKKSYDTLLREDRLGLATNLDVLQSQSSYLEYLRSKNRLEFSLRSEFAKLNRISGEQVIP